MTFTNRNRARGLLRPAVPLMMLAVVLLSAPGQGRAAPGDIFYVHGDHPNANDANDGRTVDRPWRTITKAADTLRTGETVRVRALANGAYYQELGPTDPGLSGRSGILLQYSGADGSPITFEAYPGERPILDQGGQARGFQLENVRYLTIRGFEIRNVHLAGVWARYAADNRFITVENSYIHHVSGEAGTNVGGIRFDGEPACEGCAARNNVIHSVRLGGDPDNMNAAAIHSFGLNNGILENNELYDSPQGFYHKGEAANSTSTIIRRNVIRNVLLGVRIATQSSRPQRGYRIYENIMYNIRDTGVWTGLDYSNPDLYIYNNVFDGSGIASVILFNYDDIRLWNNIFLAPSGSNVIQINAGSAATQLTESTYNLFGEGQTCVLGQNGPSPQVYTTLASWQAGTNYDRNSLAGSPTFVNRSRRDYHLAAGSLGIGTGKNGENMGAYRTGSEVIGPGPSVVRPLLQFNAAGYSVDEAGASVTVTVTRTDSSAEAVSVDYATANGSAIAGADYTSTSGTLSWAAGDNTPKGFTVAIADDTDLEGAETVNLTLSNPTGGAALGAPSTAVLTITDDDAPSSVSFSTTSYSVNEDGGSATITVARSGNSSVAATVDYATGNGTALAGADYASASGTLSWAAGDSAPKTFTVALTNDTDVEGDETVGLLLSNPIGAVLGSPANATLTVTDNDTGTPSAPAEQANLGGGCALRGAGELDPTLPLLLGMALAWLGVRSRSAARQQTVY